MMRNGKLIHQVQHKLACSKVAMRGQLKEVMNLKHEAKDTGPFS